MRRALALATRGRWSAAPNPLVGAVLLDGDRVIAEGWHERPGSPHAEAACLGNLPLEATTGRTLVINLEPCAHQGRTPPCAELLVKRRIGRVIAAHADPDPRVAGRGFERLRSSGVDLAIGSLEHEARELNRHFLCRHERGRPWVTLKWAQSLDGLIALVQGRPTTLSGAASGLETHRLRAAHPGILVGIGTVLADDPLLDARHCPGGRAPRRFVIDPLGELPPGSRLVATARTQPLHLICGRQAAGRNLRQLERAGARIHILAVDGELPLEAVLETVLAAGVDGLLVEGGARVLGRFLQAGLVDEVLRITAPLALGTGLPAAAAPRPAGPTRWHLLSRRPVGSDEWETWRPATEED
jgi:diaminohydroxyphosphoribosylaminopyrimidine deaminase / 5-amino-6-(5-phosphoribosylamino)uracil reductase